MKNGLNVGVVGGGYWGPNLVRNFNSCPDCAVTKVCDLDQARLNHIKELYPAVETTTDFDDLIKDPELNAVAIATPVNLHYPLALKSLSAGKHTFIEKPMVSSTKEGLELVRLAGEKKLTLMVDHTFIYSEPVRKIKSIVDSGDIGELIYISAERLNLGLFQKDINVTWDLAPHDISIILYIMGVPPVSINCQGKAHVNPGIEDVTNISMEFSNGGFAMISSSWLDPNKVRRMTFVGSKKMILYDDTEPLEKIKIYDKRVEVPMHYDTFSEFQYSYHYGDVHTPMLNQVEPLKVTCQHFIKCIREKTKPMTSGLEGLLTVQILEASTRSLKNKGCNVNIEWKDDGSGANPPVMSIENLHVCSLRE